MWSLNSDKRNERQESKNIIQVLAGASELLNSFRVPGMC